MAEGLSGLAQGLAQGTTYLNSAVSNRLQTEAQNRATESRAKFESDSLTAQKEQATADREFRKIAFERQKELDDRQFRIESDLADLKKTIEMGRLGNEGRAVTVEEQKARDAAEAAKAEGKRQDTALDLRKKEMEENVRLRETEIENQRVANETRARQIDAQFNAEDKARTISLMLEAKKLSQGNLEAMRSTDFLFQEHADKMAQFNRQNILNSMLTIDASELAEPVKDRMKRGLLRVMVLTGQIQEDMIASTNSPSSIVGSAQALKQFNEVATIATQDFHKAIGEGKSDMAAFVEYMARMDIAANETRRLLLPNAPNRIKSEDVDGVVDAFMKMYGSAQDAQQPGTSNAPKRLKMTEVEGPKGLQFLKAKGVQ